MERFADAGLMVDAGLQLTPGKPSLRSLRDQIDRILQTKRIPKRAASKRIVSRRHREQWLDQLTLLMVTHFTDKLRLNRHLAPPGTGLVGTTFSSMSDVLGSGIKQCPKILIYDRKRESDPEEEAYRQNLRAFARANGFDMLEMQCGGLQQNMTTAIAKVQTPYTLWVEHDWEFLPPRVDLAEIINVFERYHDINMIRFNKRSNAVAGFDYIMEKETVTEKVNLIRTSAYSNNPQVVRTEKLRNHWLPLCRSDTVAKQYDLSCTAFGIEEPLFKNMIHDLRQSGFEAAHARWGTYVYGQVNDPPKIRHLGC